MINLAEMIKQFEEQDGRIAGLNAALKIEKQELATCHARLEKTQAQREALLRLIKRIEDAAAMAGTPVDQIQRDIAEIMSEKES